MKADEILDLEVRRTIYNLILNHPGLYLREISRKLKIPKTTLSYHLTYLKKKEFIIAKPGGRYLRYYDIKEWSKIDKRIINFLRQNTPRHIILYVLTGICASQIEISKDLDKDPKTIEFHLKKMLDMDIIEIAPVGEGVVYRLKSPKVIERTPVKNEIFYRLKKPQLIYDLIVAHKKSLSDDFVVIFLDFMGNTRPDKLPDRFKKPEYYYNLIEKGVWEVFPHPYHA
ncbi:MAG: winged helix-turn-helix transcriptional regulator [Thermoplasmatales archaeon]|nr:MAG: winged helix-turn-helix transcriptional regulator [Thermoplasmatales archaeon]